jgi:hypothetical protein
MSRFVSKLSSDASILFSAISGFRGVLPCRRLLQALPVLVVDVVVTELKATPLLLIGARWAGV